MIDLYYAGTANGKKVAIMLHEVQVPYRLRVIDIFEGEQLTREYGRVNPNHKIPAIVDHAPAWGGEPHAVFESGAILQYLAEKTGQLLPVAGPVRSRALQWLAWQVACLGPMVGQFAHFTRYAPPGNDYAIERYTREYHRLLAVLDNRLGQAAYLAGDEYTIADIAVWPSMAGAAKMGRPTGPNIERWVALVNERPAVKAMLAKPELEAPPKYTGLKQKLSAEEWSNMFGERMHGAVKQG